MDAELGRNFLCSLILRYASIEESGFNHRTVHPLVEQGMLAIVFIFSGVAVARNMGPTWEIYLMSIRNPYSVLNMTFLLCRVAFDIYLRIALWPSAMPDL